MRRSLSELPCYAPPFHSTNRNLRLKSLHSLRIRLCLSNRTIIQPLSMLTAMMRAFGKSCFAFLIPAGLPLTSANLLAMFTSSPSNRLCRIV